MIVLSGNLFVYFDQSPGLVKGCVLLCLFFVGLCLLVCRMCSMAHLGMYALFLLLVPC